MSAAATHEVASVVATHEEEKGIEHNVLRDFCGGYLERARTCSQLSYLFNAAMKTIISRLETATCRHHI
jgi:hypothetical protein